MSRTSALTTFRLIGSPTKPAWPYCRPWFDCADMLSFAGETAGLAGVGEGSGWAGSTTADVREDLAVVPADEAPIASAKPLRDKPPAHASANALMATFLKCLGIIPSSGIAC